jgi:hypothetical protein
MSVRTLCWLLPQSEQYISASGIKSDVHFCPESERQPGALPCPLSAKADIPSGLHETQYGP